MGLVSLAACAAAPPAEVPCRPRRTEATDWVSPVDDPAPPPDERRAWGETTAGCRSSISPVEQTVTAGGPINLTITLRNDGPSPIRVPRSGTPEQTYTSFTVARVNRPHAVGHDTRPVPLTRRGRKLLLDVDPAMVHPVEVGPGEERSFPVHFGALFDLSDGGTFTVQVKKGILVVGSKGARRVEVVSNQVTLHVWGFRRPRPQDVEFRDISPRPGSTFCPELPRPPPPNDPRVWGETVRGCRISLGPVSQEVTTGETVDLIVAFRNDGPDIVDFVRVGGFEQEFTDLTVLHDGNPVPVTERGRHHLVEIDPTSCRTMPIPLGDEFTVPIHLSAHFDMSLPGEYTVEVKKGTWINRTGAAPRGVTSNRITIHVRDYPVPP